MKFSQELRSLEDSLEINITPLIDIVFLLLIFFMVTTTFDMAQGISIDLPGASSQPAHSVPKAYRISLNEQGDVFIDSEKVSLAELTQKLIAIKAEGSKKDSITLWADKAVKHGKVVQVMDTVRTSGIESMAVATRPLPSNG